MAAQVRLCDASIRLRAQVHMAALLFRRHHVRSEKYGWLPHHGAHDDKDIEVEAPHQRQESEKQRLGSMVEAALEGWKAAQNMQDSTFS